METSDTEEEEADGTKDTSTAECDFSCSAHDLTDGNLAPEGDISPTGVEIMGIQSTPDLKIPHLTEVRMVAEEMPSTDAARITMVEETDDNTTVSDVGQVRGIMRKTTSLLTSSGGWKDWRRL